jgi:hypothetical protein
MFNMIYEEKRENDWRLDIKALLTGTGYITINSTTKAVAKPARQFGHAMQIFPC